MKFSIKDLSSKCDQICNSNFRNFITENKSLMEKVIFCVVKMKEWKISLSLNFFSEGN